MNQRFQGFEGCTISTLAKQQNIRVGDVLLSAFSESLAQTIASFPRVSPAMVPVRDTRQVHSAQSLSQKIGVPVEQLNEVLEKNNVPVLKRENGTLMFRGSDLDALQKKVEQSKRYF